MQTENQEMYNEYVEQVRNEVRRKTGKRVILQKVNKNNGLVLDSLTILADGTNVAPTIYLNEFFQDYVTHGVDVVVNRIIRIYEENKIEGAIDVSFFTDIEKVMPRIRIKLVNYEKNRELLEDVPHVKFLDLAVMFTVVLESGHGDGFASILIHNRHLELWNMDMGLLYNTAMENIAYDYEVIPMSDVIESITGEKPEQELMKDAVNGMGVLTNHSKLHGAAGMVHRDILDCYMEMNHTKKLIILPASIHEVILVACDQRVNMESYRDMVRDVNVSQVEPEEVLSSNIYVYDGNSITIAD